MNPDQIRKEQAKLAHLLPLSELVTAASRFHLFVNQIASLASTVTDCVQQAKPEAMRDDAIRALKRALLADQGQTQAAFNVALHAVMRHPLVCDLAPGEPLPQPVQPEPESVEWEGPAICRHLDCYGEIVPRHSKQNLLLGYYCSKCGAVYQIP